MSNDLKSDGAPRVVDREAVERDVAEIAQSDLAGLRKRWRKAFGYHAPPGLYREFLARALAYRIQAEVCGDLDRDLKLKLAKLADGDEKALDGHRTRLKPGTILVREWKGALQRVMVMADGYAWNGETYASLSAAARAIAGTSWNGPAFFGLTSGKKRKARKDGRA